MAIGYYASYHDIPVVSLGCTDIALADKSTFDTLIRIRPDFHKIGVPFMELMMQFNWKLASVSINLQSSPVSKILEITLLMHANMILLTGLHKS